MHLFRISFCIQCQLFPELRWRHAALFPEKSTEIQWIFVPDQIGYFRNIITGCFQKYFGIGNS